MRAVFRLAAGPALAGVLAGFPGAVASADERITECDARASAGNLAEPWSDNSRTFAEGAVRVARLHDADAPECCRHYLLVLAPTGEATPAGARRQCLVVAPGGERGFRELDIGGIEAGYSPHIGLTLSVPVWLHREGTAPDAQPFADRMILLINQQTGSVSVE